MDNAATKWFESSRRPSFLRELVGPFFCAQGGAMRKIPLSKVFVSDEIKQKVLQVIDSEQYILGPNCSAFEQELACYIGTQHCVLASNWTSAVHMLLLAMKLKPGDEVLVPSL